MNILLPDAGEIAVLGERDTAHGPGPRQLPARGARPLQEDDGPPPAPLLRRAEGHEGRRAGRRHRHLARADGPRPTAIDKKVDALSKGMAQKVQFIAAVVAGPELLILDEPFTGLDPVNREVLKDAVLDLRKARHHDRLLDPRHGGRREPVRPHLHDLQGQEGARRHARRDPGRVRHRHHPRPNRRRRRRAGRPADVESMTDSGQRPGRALARATRRTSSAP